MHESSLCYCAHSIITHSPDRAAEHDPHLLLLLHRVKTGKTASATEQQLIMRAISSECYTELSHYARLYKSKVDRNAGYCSNQPSVTRKLTGRTELGFVNCARMCQISLQFLGAKLTNVREILLSFLTINSVLISCEKQFDTQGL